MNRSISSRPVVRGLAAFLVVVSVLQIRPAIGAPGDIFEIPAPGITADPPKATDIKDGDASVATQTGALQYSYPIQVAPGRNGMAPQLALSYSSQAPNYGGIAAGWSLSVPIITEDHSEGRLRTRSALVELAQAFKGDDPKADDRFVSSMAGGRPLIMVTEPTDVSSDVYAAYRAQNDTSFTRYERMDTTAPYRWRARTSDGNVLTFGEATRMPGCAPPSDQDAPLTGMIDPFGNEVIYMYQKGVPGECRLAAITWGRNSKAGVGDFAAVSFSYGTGSAPAPSCAGVYTNSQLDYRSGTKIVTGASRLVMITATAFPPGDSVHPVHFRQIALGYDDIAESCNQGHAPVRLLKTIRESAWGTDSPRVYLPPVTFDYNSLELTHVASPPGTAPAGWPTTNVGWGYRGSSHNWPSVEVMFVDVDGDGLQDILENASPGSATECVASWRKNDGLDSSGKPRFVTPAHGLIQLPRLKWRGAASPWPVAGASQADPYPPHYERCALNGQATAYRNAYPLALRCHHRPGPCRAAEYPGADPSMLYCDPGGTLCPEDDGGPWGGGEEFVTQLSYRWLDVDSDGLVDLVAAVHGDIDSYDIERGNLQTPYDFTGGELSMYGIPGLDQWPSCPGDVDRCHRLDNCLEDHGARVCDRFGCTVDWGVVLTCMADTPTVGCASVLAKPAGGPEGKPGMGDTRHPYERCEGLYPWFIYKNKGNGDFETNPIIKYQPLPLESASGDSSFGSSIGVTSESQAIIDFDGDGRLDAVARGTEQNNGVFSADLGWNVWLGDGTGGFLPRAYLFPTRNMTPCSGFGCFGENALSATGGKIGGDGTVGGFETSSLAGLLDVNGDGALDHWLAAGMSPSAGYANIAFNYGDEIKLVAPSPGTGEVTTFSAPPYRVKPGNDTFVVPTDPSGNPLLTISPGSQIEHGYTTAKTRVLDVDNDGRVDIVSFDAASSIPRVFFNVGGQFITPGVSYSSIAALPGLRRKAEAVPGSPGLDVWQLDADLMDLDGDGFQESASWAPNGFTWAKPANTQPLRLLRAVDNGRGAVTTITYAHMHDKNAVEQHSDETWPDGRPKASPRTQWVVKSLTTHDDVASTNATTSYFYKNPRYSADKDGHYSFRGFEEVTTTKPDVTGEANGSRVVERYGFNVDWSGRLIETVVMPSVAEGANDARTVDRTSWQELTLFGGKISTYHPSLVEHFTCSNGQDRDTCTTLGMSAGYTQTTKSYTAYPQSVGREQLWVESGSVLEAPNDPNAESRMTSTSYELTTDPDDYRLRPTDVEKQHDVSGTWVTYAKSHQTWAPQNGALVTEEVWVDSNDADRAVTAYFTDPNTGNRLYKWKPEQWAVNQNFITNLVRTSYTYDSRKLFVATETNERGHVRNYTWEYGTGTKLKTTGPNTHEEHRIRVDGLGRMIERYEPSGLYYQVPTIYKVETNMYVDGPNSSVTHKKAIDQTGGVVRYAQDKTELDGHGRPIRTTVYTSAPANQITTFHYAGDGTLAQVDVPDPSKNDASTVSYTYTHDSLGRPLSIRRPDATNPAERSGVDLAYEGLTQTSSEFLGAGTGQPAVTKTINDSFGRLVEVDEQLTDTPTLTWASTSYEYDANDNVVEITDPKGVVTSLQHDFAGQRTAITRATRTWSYAYDRNGNLVSETAPCSGLDCASYITSIVYDELDRPISKDLAPGALSDPDVALFGSDYETFGYDDGGTGKGRLTHWASYPPGVNSQPTNQSWYTWDVQGNEAVKFASFFSAGLPYAASQERDQRYHISNNIQRVYYKDNVDGRESVATFDYDERGLPKQVDIWQQYLDIHSYVINQRDVAGLVTKRYSAPGAGAFTYVSSDWTYDKLGRVTSQTIARSGQQVARQVLEYNGNDDPARLEHTLDTSHVNLFTFGYDKRHQLTDVDENALPHAFTAAYAYNEAGRFMSATETAASLPGSDVKPRDVDYHYAGVDPEQITSLADTSGTYASYTYDLAGNQTTRSYPGTGESWDYEYDGKNQLRRATRKLNGVVTGSEEYWYDENGARQIVVKRDASGAKTETIWFFGDVETHYNGNSTDPVQTYAHISMGTPVGRVERKPGQGSSLEYQFHGLASNTLATIDNATGTVNASFVYAPFGEIIEATDGGSGSGAGIEAHRRRMNDKYVDEVSGLAYYGFRYYDNLSMTWTQSDPLFRFAPDAAWEQPRKSLLYTNDLNNPLRYLDPDGRCPTVAGLGGGGLCAAYDAVGATDNTVESNAKAILGGLKVLDSTTNPAAYAERGRNHAVAAVDAAFAGDAKGMYYHAKEAEANTAIAIAMVIFMAKGAEDATSAPEALKADVTESCFVAGTLVSTPRGQVPIEQIRLGDRVKTDNLRCASEHIGVDVRAISLSVKDPLHPDSPITVELARPLSWLHRQHFRDGRFWLTLPEVGHGWATVTNIGPRPREQDGPGCLVLMTVRHSASEILDLRFVDGTTLGVTPSHPLYEEGVGWTVAGQLTPGSVLRSENGPSSVKSIEPGLPNRTVYNLEVSLQHMYYVGQLGVWAHNQCAGNGRAGRQERLSQLGDDPKVSSADRGWIKQEQNAIKRGTRQSIRNPPGKQLAHTRGREAAKGYSHTESPSNLQDTDLHRTQHKFDDFGRKNKERK